MPTSSAISGDKFLHTRDRGGDDLDGVTHPGSAVSWSAIAAGGAAAAALSLILLILGVGLGLSSVSPWSDEGMRAGSFGVSTIIWLTVTQLLASALGGYLAGRLRIRWIGVHRDEVYFRDTAHGFLAWAVASLATAALLTSTIGSIVGGGANMGAAALGGASASAVEAATSARTSSGPDEGPMAYFVDALFRRDLAAPAADAVDATSSEGTRTRANASELAEAGRIFMHASRTQSLPPEDLRYVAQTVAQRTGLSQAAAEKRVSDAYVQAQSRLNEAEVAARDAADKARKASAYGALWLFVSLLVGAFIASWAATFGGQQRDN